MAIPTTDNYQRNGYGDRGGFDRRGGRRGRGRGGYRNGNPPPQNGGSANGNPTPAGKPWRYSSPGDLFGAAFVMSTTFRGDGQRYSDEDWSGAEEAKQREDHGDDQDQRRQVRQRGGSVGGERGGNAGRRRGMCNSPFVFSWHRILLYSCSLKQFMSTSTRTLDSDWSTYSHPLFPGLKYSILRNLLLDLIRMKN